MKSAILPHLFGIFFAFILSICFELKAESSVFPNENQLIANSNEFNEKFNEVDTINDENAEEIKENYEENENYYEEKADFGDLFENFLNSQQDLVNHSMISFGTGFSFNMLPQNLLLEKNLPNTQLFNFEYGFVRFDSAYRTENLRAYSSEFTFIESNTNRFGLFERRDNQIYDNQFGFGVGLRSGMGINFSSFELYLLHSSAFAWTYFDYDLFADPANQNSAENNFFKTFDQQYKFGFRGAASLELRLSRNTIIDFEYEHNNFFSGMEYGKWFGSWATDLILQRWIDIFEPVFIERFGNQYPFIKFFYKNSVAIILSEIRNRQQFFPFKSDYSLLQRRFILKFKFVF